MYVSDMDPTIRSILLDTYFDLQSSIQGEHKITPWFQVVIKSKLTGIFL
jgi:hypothetical protein